MRAISKADVEKTAKQKGDFAWYEVVKSLSDINICKALANVEGLSTYIQSDLVRIVVPDGDDYYFDPLNNNDQLIGLMIKHDVVREWEG